MCVGICYFVQPEKFCVTVLISLSWHSTALFVGQSCLCLCSYNTLVDLGYKLGTKAEDEANTHRERLYAEISGTLPGGIYSEVCSLFQFLIQGRC